MNQTITLPQAVLRRLEKLSAASRRTPQSIVKRSIMQTLEYEEWALEQIDKGMAELKAGKGIPHEQFWAS